MDATRANITVLKPPNAPCKPRNTTRCRTFVEAAIPAYTITLPKVISVMIFFVPNRSHSIPVNGAHVAKRPVPTSWIIPVQCVASMSVWWSS